MGSLKSCGDDSDNESDETSPNIADLLHTHTHTRRTIALEWQVQVPRCQPGSQMPSHPWSH